MSLTPNSSQDIRPSHWNPKAIASVAAISVFVFLFTYFRIFKQLCRAPPRGLTLSRNRVPRRLLDGSDADDPSLQFRSHGLESPVLHSLPVAQFNEKVDGGMNQRSTECAVCLGEFKQGEWLRHLPSCSHSFHVSCIDTWFQNHSDCPLCRSVVHSVELDLECPVPVYNLLQSLGREDFFRERAAHYQLLRSEILQNTATRRELMDAD